MDTALPQKFPFILDRNLAKTNCTGNHVCTSCDTVVLVQNIKWIMWKNSYFFNKQGGTENHKWISFLQKISKFISYPICATLLQVAIYFITKLQLISIAHS